MTHLTNILEHIYMYIYIYTSIFVKCVSSLEIVISLTMIMLEPKYFEKCII